MKDGKAALYEDLKRQILTMDLYPDEDLDEARLSERYSLSRTPVREILRRLAGEGFVEIHENRGARVVPMDHATLRSFFQVAPMIYGAIGRLAVHNHTASQLADLKATQARFREAASTKDATAMVMENNRFHAIMGHMSRNKFLQASLDRLLIDHARIGHTVYRPHNEAMDRHFAASVAEHDLLIEAIERRDEDAVADLVFEHWEPSREKMEMYVAPQAMKAEKLSIQLDSDVAAKLK
ncbi:GntR family transcriptional regulator [Pseudomonas syringae]|uniref:GntR family transcriptional regulator n=1 Tax=Pseudomonas syringae TaxID=317 RepID=UPI000BB65AC6|nr:GntR family transcriptional regulator [Pseudomonas syringae]PBQ09314.1 GntR family transcriptional regulator [Pseudomonas syringae]